MANLDDLGLLALLLGLGCFALAGFAQLLKQTHGVPIRHRMSAMVRSAVRGIRPYLPSRRATIAGAGGVGAFLGAGGLCAACVLGVVAAISSTRPQYKEAYEGFGDAVLGFACAGFGLSISLLVGVVAGFAAASHLSQNEPQAAANPSTATEAE